MKVLIVGGVAGGATTAARLRRLKPKPPKQPLLSAVIMYLTQIAVFPIM